MKLRNSTVSGMSLVEVMVALVVLGIMSPLIYGLYTQMYRYYFSVSERTDSVLEATVAKRSLDRYWADIDSVLSVDQHSIRYLSTKGRVDEIAIRKGELFWNSKRIAREVTEAKFFYLSSTCGSDEPLVWEMKVKERWISGAGE